jgi:hypothetical protein
MIVSKARDRPFAVVVEEQEGLPSGGAVLDTAMREECIRKWLSKRKSWSMSFYFFRTFLLWLWKIPEWNGKMPHELLDFQDKAIGRDRHILVDLIEEHTQERGGTYNTMVQRASILRMFFVKNHVEIPKTLGWQPQPTKESVPGMLNLDSVREIIVRSDLRGRAVFLTMFQGMMDLERFTYFNTRYAEKLVTHLKTKSLTDSFRIDFLAGRKRNRRPYYTFIYHDALKAWHNYFEKDRSWPTPGEALALTLDHVRPIGKIAISDYFNTVARRLKIKPPKVSGARYAGIRTGIAVHEAFRDVSRSLLQKATQKNFDITCAEFFMATA